MEKLQTGILDEKTMALVAVGVAFGINCHPCLTKTVDMAKKIGANREEMEEAIKVARSVRAGGSKKIEAWAEELLKGKTEEEKEDCGCAEQKQDCC